MITVYIDDTQLEQRINEEANATGKSAQLVIEELLSAVLPTRLEHPHLNPNEHGYIIADSFVANEHATDSPLFSQVSDAADYVSNVRKASWRRQ